MGRRAIGATVCAMALACVPTAQAAGPTAIATDGGTVYAGFESGAVKRYSAADGAQLSNWQTPVADANAALGGIVALDVAPGAQTVWVLDRNRRVQEFDHGGAYIRGFRLGQCESSNDPDPGEKGGIDVTATAVYVAHPCANEIARYPLGSLPASGGSSPPAVDAQVYSPHGIAAPPALPTAAGTEALYVTQPRSAAVRRYDLSTLAQLGDAAPITHTGSPDDLYVGGSGGEGRVLVSETQNQAAGYAHRVYAYQPAGDGSFTEIFNFGGLGVEPAQLDDAVAFDAVEGGIPATVVVADRGNERVQRLTATSPSNAGNLVWLAGASDPGPPPVPAQPNAGGGGGGEGPGGGRADVSINDGDRFTPTPNVLLRIDEPAGAEAIEISNRAGFGSPTRVPSGTRTLDWTLLEEEPDRRRRRVFVRFPGSGQDVVSDEIRLDRRKPKVGSARVLRRKRRWILRVRAADATSGLAELQIASDRRGPYEPQAFSPDTTLQRPADARWVRVADGVGNVSDAKRVRREARR